MCGIAGAINWGNPESLRCMGDLQAHRGPDDAGTWHTQTSRGDWVGLASLRLSILDLSQSGHMPMRTPDGRFTIVYNGECYNHGGLRQELEAAGYVFRSHSDTETVLYSYQHFGSACLNRMNGIFAFAIWDAQEETLFLARDHFGIKPLYYCQRGPKFCFASEIKAFYALPDFEPAINSDAVYQYLSMLWTPDPETAFSGVLKLPAGHFGLWKNGSFAITKYWDLQMPPLGECPDISEQDLGEEVRARFFRTVKSQMISDVPLGAFLSAGLDSTGIVSAMAHQTSEPVRTFTIGFPPNYLRGEVMMDDISVAKRTAEYLGCRHTEIVVKPDVVDLLPKLIYHMDEPTADPQILISYLVCKEARKQVTVLLSGVGGDEVFGGYRKYRAHQLAHYYKQIPAPLRAHCIEPLVNALPTFRGTPAKGYVRLLKKMVQSGSLPPRDRFLKNSCYLDARQLAELCMDDFLLSVRQTGAFRTHEQHFAEVAHADFLNQMLYVDIKTFMVSLNLMVADKTSMACSVETRVPFLDWEFVQWVASNVPPHLKLKGGITKYMYREAMKSQIPAEVLRQKKAGFTAPIDMWLANDLKEFVRDLLSSERLKRHGIFKPQAVESMLREQSAGIRDWTYPIWQVLTFELWMEQFLYTKQHALTTA
ncbi:MAG TPA: asparagine synthase (glutamine-hydrolyzing) [Terriglobales bacterium]|jgi:asparagine synthase (glutamine-hydrolysing)|nr:asparagine synthase (glutamine-hydrolyzing) [Terriglobales bacterium]